MTLIVGPLSVHSVISGKSAKLSGMAGKILRCNILNGSKTVSHYFTCCASLSKWPLLPSLELLLAHRKTLQHVEISAKIRIYLLFNVCFFENWFSKSMNSFMIFSSST